MALPLLSGGAGYLRVPVQLHTLTRRDENGTRGRTGAPRSSFMREFVGSFRAFRVSPAGAMC
jgi:hypothetical protein